MSDTDTGDGDEGQDEGLDTEGEDQEQPEEGDDGEPQKPAEDWQKRAHNHAGQAARERSKRRAAEARAADLESRLEKLEKSGGAPREDELLALIASLPDSEDDPVGDIAAVKRALKLYRDREVQSGQQSEQQQAIERQVNKLRGAMNESEEDFAIEHADYYEAATHYRNARIEELKEAGYSGKYLDQKLADDLFGVVRMALDSGQDPAERVYALSQKRGFRPGMKAANGKLDKLQSAAATGMRPVAQGANGTLSWGDVAKLDGPARDKAFAKLREREMNRKLH